MKPTTLLTGVDGIDSKKFSNHLRNFGLVKVRSGPDLQGRWATNQGF